MRKLIAVAGLALIVSACGSGGGSSPTGSASDGGSDASSAGTSSGAASLTYVDSVKSDVETLLGNGSFEPPPTTAPEHSADITVAVIDTMAASSQADAANATIEAAESLGWETIFYDYNLDPAGAGKLIESAISRGVDAITLDVVDCRYVQSALEQAKAAGIPVVAVEGYDCNETDPGAQPLFAATVQYPMGGQVAFYEALYTAMAQYPIAKLDGNSNAIYFVDNVYQASISSVDTVKGVYEPCDTCKLTVDQFGFDQFGNLQQRTQTLLLKDPEVNSLIPSYADITTAGVQAAAAASGRQFVINAGDSLLGPELVVSGKATYGYGFPAGWKGYALIDTVIRTLAGEPAVSSGMGVNLFNADHNLDAEGKYVVPYDYATLYKQAWGVS